MLMMSCAFPSRAWIWAGAFRIPYVFADHDAEGHLIACEDSVLRSCLKIAVFVKNTIVGEEKTCAPHLQARRHA